jgi:DNA-binding NarL/FixJ family response regulator
MRLLLAEGRAFVRAELKRAALEIDGACECVEAGDQAAARAALWNAPLDAALFDALLLDARDIVALRRDRPRLLLLALFARADVAASTRLLVAGVDAVIPRCAPASILAAALRVTLAGDVWVRGNRVAHAFPTHAERVLPDARRGSGPLNLTARQYDVLALVAQRRSNKAIAAELGIGVRTVKGHVSIILRALKADNRIDAGRAARRWLASAPSGDVSPVVSA